MKQSMLVNAAILAAALAATGAAQAQSDTLKKIKDSGSVTMGVRESSGALAYTLGDGKYVGFHTEVCHKVLADIQKHADCWGHYHTGGVPGRNEIDNTQTLDYPKLMRAIAESGYQGYVGQEFIPKRADALESLKQAVAVCDV